MGMVTLVEILSIVGIQPVCIHKQAFMDSRDQLSAKDIKDKVLADC